MRHFYSMPHTRGLSYGASCYTRSLLPRTVSHSNTLIFSAASCSSGSGIDTNSISYGQGTDVTSNIRELLLSPSRPTIPTLCFSPDNSKTLEKYHLHSLLEDTTRATIETLKGLCKPYSKGRVPLCAILNTLKQDTNSAKSVPLVLLLSELEKEFAMVTSGTTSSSPIEGTADDEVCGVGTVTADGARVCIQGIRQCIYAYHGLQSTPSNSAEVVENEINSLVEELLIDVVIPCYEARLSGKLDNLDDCFTLFEKALAALDRLAVKYSAELCVQEVINDGEFVIVTEEFRDAKIEFIIPMTSVVVPFILRKFEYETDNPFTIFNSYPTHTKENSECSGATEAKMKIKQSEIPTFAIPSFIKLPNMTMLSDNKEKVYQPTLQKLLGDDYGKCFPTVKMTLLEAQVINISNSKITKAEFYDRLRGLIAKCYSANLYTFKSYYGTHYMHEVVTPEVFKFVKNSPGIIRQFVAAYLIFTFFFTISLLYCLMWLVAYLIYR
eukprot:Tbor_TRINITY_DN4880_c0_g1::TRINITY_DN4880_c0_g1_i1::g.1247::m.1247